MSNHNFETKTLVPVPPMPMDDNEQAKEDRRQHMNHNKEIRIERGQ